MGKRIVQCLPLPRERLMMNRMALLHQNSGAIGRSIPSALILMGHGYYTSQVLVHGVQTFYHHFINPSLECCMIVLTCCDCIKSSRDFCCARALTILLTLCLTCLLIIRSRNMHKNKQDVNKFGFFQMLCKSTD